MNILLAALLLAAPALHALVISADVDKTSVSVGEPFTLSFRLPSACPGADVPLPESPRYEIISKDLEQAAVKRLTGTKTIGRGGNLSRGGRLVYTLKALEPGPLVFEPIGFQCRGRSSTFRRELLVKPTSQKDMPLSSVAPLGEFSGKTVALQNIGGHGAGGPLSGGEPDLPAARPAAPAETVGAPAIVAEEQAPEGMALWLGRANAAAASVKKQAARLSTDRARIFQLGLALVFIIVSALWGWIAGILRRRREAAGLAVVKVRDETKAAESGPQVIGGKFRIESKIGEGGMGEVYLAKDLKLPRQVAVKKMKIELKYSSAGRGDFIKEAMMLSRLTHPYIVSIHEIIEEKGEVFMILDYVEGKSLDKVIHERQKLDLKSSLEILAYVCQAIDFAHESGVLHLDLKPANIMIDKSGFAKVMDFGISREFQNAFAEADVGGSPAYMSPEQHKGTVGRPADLYALGVSLYQMLTGQLPFRGGDLEGKKERVEYFPASQLDAGLAPAIDEFFARALAPDPARRWASAKEFLEALKAISR